MYEQAVFICLLLPFLSNLWGVPFSQLPSYLKDGAACFLNIGTMSNGKSLSSHDTLIIGEYFLSLLRKMYRSYLLMIQLSLHHLVIELP